MKTLMPMQEMDENFHPVMWCLNTLKDPKQKKSLGGFSEVLLCGYVTCCWNYVTHQPTRASLVGNWGMTQF